MLNKKFLIILALAAEIAGYAGDSKKALPQQKEQAFEWMQNQPVKFLENRGQMIDMNNEPVPFVLFKAEATGMNMYITEKGGTIP
jgi:hypothetical protein